MLTESLIALTLGAATLSAAASLSWAEWRRLQCAVTVFKAAHSALRRQGSPGSSPLPFTPGRATVRIQEDASGVTAQRDCGGARESLRLLNLEAWARKDGWGHDFP